MYHVLYGAALSAASRALSGELKIDGKALSALDSTIDAFDEVQRTVDDLSVDRPGTWLRFARRVLQRSLNRPDITWNDQWFEHEGYTRKDQRLPALWLDLCARAPRTIAFREDREVVWRYQIEDEHFFVPQAVGTALGGASAQWWSRTLPEVQLPNDPMTFARVKTAIARFFWRDRSAVLLDYVNDSVQFVAIEDVGGSDYIGPLNELIETWAGYRSHGIRRSVLLQGTPGTGKSTFARAAARRLSQRTVFMTAAAADNISESDWQVLIEFLAPEMIVLDDVDRLAESTLEGNLRMFEEYHCTVPFIFFTSNDHTRLPRPMRRPGRIDQILQLDQPARPVVEQIVRELAVREGVEIPAERLPALVEIGCEMSIAHVVEALRRARVEGWEHASLPCDITFGEGFVEDSRERSPDEATRALANLARNGVPLAELPTSLQRILLEHTRH